MSTLKKAGPATGLVLALMLALAACQPQSQVVEVTRVVQDLLFGFGGAHRDGWGLAGSWRSRIGRGPHRRRAGHGGTIPRLGKTPGRDAIPARGHDAT